MNIIVIGLGSMGKRRVRLLKEYIKNNKLDETQWTIVGVDAKDNRKEEANKLFGITCFSSIKEATNNFDIEAAVISTSPLSHSSIISECLQNNLHVFTEINLVADGYEKNMALASEKNKVLFLSSTPMYRKEMQYIKEVVNSSNNIFNYRYHIGQYLPDWHPWENYKDFFVGDKRTNGCREIFAIELPWMVDSFGEIKSVASLHTKITDLNLNYDDTYQVLIKHKSGIIGQLSVDVSTPKTERHLELWTENYYLEWKGTGDSLYLRNEELKELKLVDLYSDIVHEEGYNSFIVENAYYDEIAEYIDAIVQNKVPKHNFEKDKKVLDWIDEIEK